MISSRKDKNRFSYNPRSRIVHKKTQSPQKVTKSTLPQVSKSTEGLRLNSVALKSTFSRQLTSTIPKRLSDWLSLL